MSVNRLRARLASGESAVGGWCVTPSLLTAEIFATEGADYVCVDCQHGLIHVESMVPMLAAVAGRGTTPVVRVPSNDAAWIGKALDAGAEAVIVPLVNTAEEAAAAAIASRYPPAGARSYGPVRASMLLNDHAPPADVDAQVQCFVMIETAAAVERAEAIVATPGVDGVYVGPSDLALSMGAVPGGSLPREHAEAVEHVRTACEVAGKIAGIHTSGGEEAHRYLAAGFRMVTIATDAVLLRQAVRSHLGAARA